MKYQSVSKIAFSKYTREVCTILILMLLFFPSTVASQEALNDEISINEESSSPGLYPSLMWEITKEGVEEPSYLYGTMHVSRKVAFHLGDTFFLALRAVDVVALESNPGEWMEKYTTSDFYQRNTLTRSKHFNSFAYRNFYRDLFFPDFPEAKTFSELLSKRYNVMEHMLYRKSEALQDFEEQTYLDLFIFQAAAKQDKKIIGLEDFELAREYVNIATTPPDITPPTPPRPRNYNRIRYRFRSILEDSYRKGDLDMIDSISKMMSPNQRYITYMLYKRNVLMANTIDSVISSGSTIFAACGAAHLPGDSSVIELLRDMGYTLRPIERTINKFQHKAKEKIDEKIVRLPMERYTSPDKEFSVKVPGKLYSNVIFSNFGEYFFPDMINGSYFVVNRFPTYAPLRDHDADYVKARFDSLIYEFVPGRINRFREKTIDGFKAYDISAVTAAGDKQRYHIAFTPMEVIVFKISGSKKYVKRGRTARRFFNSIELNMGKDKEWKNYQNRYAGFSIDLPSYIISDTMTVFHRGTRDMLIQAYDIESQTYYMVINGSYHDFNYIEEDRFELDFMADQLADQFDLNVVDSSYIDVNGNPAFKFTMLNQDSDFSYHCKIAIKGPSYYLLITPTDDKNLKERFFSSFKLFDPSFNKEDFYVYNDTVMNFSVTTVCDRPEVQRRSQMFYNFNTRKLEDRSHQSETINTYFFDHRSLELIRLNYIRHNKYTHYESLDDLWESRINIVNKDSTYIINELHRSDSGLVNTLHITLTDTNSSRAIHHKWIQKHGAIYRLSTVTDTLNQLSNFANTFFSTFTPNEDTLVGWNIFADKGVLFLNDIVDKDSLTRAQARNSIGFVSLEDHHKPLLIERIKNPCYDEFTFSFRRSLIFKLSLLESPEITEFLESYYKDITDTVTLQTAVLQALANQKNEKALTAFLNCLEHDVPLPTRTQEISSIFYRLSDSLEIAKLLFPEFFKYTRYNEYEERIYNLLAEISDSNLIAASDYSQFFDEIYKKARESWRRQLAREEEELDRRSDFFTGRRYGRNPGVGFNDRVVTNFKLLLPFYEQDRRVKELSDLIFTTTGSINLKEKLAVSMILKDINVADTLIHELSSNPITMFDFYKNLQEIDKPEYFDTTVLNQRDFGHSILYKEARLQEKDTLKFYDKHHVEARFDEGYIYFYKRKDEDDNYWRLCYVGFMPTDTTQVIYEDYIRNTSIRIYDNDDIDELIEKELRKIRLRGRERAERINFEGDSFRWLFF